MAKHYLVDGYNYLYRIHRLPDGSRALESHRRWLADRLAPLVRWLPENELRIVWDARSPDAPVLQIETYFERVRGEFPGGQSADDRIIEIVHFTETPGRFVVVSDDGHVLGQASKLGARTMGVDDLEQQLLTGQNPGFDKEDPQQSEDEIRYWKLVFGASDPPPPPSASA